MSLFHVEKSVFAKALSIFERTEKSFDQDVETVKKWIQSQPHLPEIMDDVKIRNFLLLNKCSVEKTKQKIDMYYTIRRLIPDMYEDCNPNLSHQIKRYMDNCYLVPHSKLLNGLYRVFFARLKTPNQSLSPLTGVKLSCAIQEVRLKEDCMIGDIYILDATNATINDLMQFTLPTVKKVNTIYQNVYSMRIKAVYIINSSSYISNLLDIVKLVTKQKIIDRIQVHTDEKVLKELFSDDDLPKDYGGNGPSLEELNGLLKAKFAEYQERFDQLDKLKVDESLRPEKLNNDEFLGFYGNFKQLSLD